MAARHRTADTEKLTQRNNTLGVRSWNCSGSFDGLKATDRRKTELAVTGARIYPGNCKNQEQVADERIIDNHYSNSYALFSGNQSPSLWNRLRPYTEFESWQPLKMMYPHFGRQSLLSNIMITIRFFSIILRPEAQATPQYCYGCTNQNRWQRKTDSEEHYTRS